MIDTSTINNAFPLNRFNFSFLIAYVKKEVPIPNIITDNNTGIEFYGADTISKEILIDLLENFSRIDNLAQNERKQKYEKSTQSDVENFQFEPSWVEISPDSITVGYVGIYINSDYSMTFSKINDEWTLLQ